MSSKSSRPASLRAFLTQVDAFRAALEKAKARSESHGPEALFGHALYMAGGRTPVFMLQGLSRIYRKLELEGQDAEIFDRLRLQAKVIEDVLGQIDFWWTVRRKAAEHGLPAAVIDWAEQRHVEACGEAQTWLAAREWIIHRYIEDPENFVPRADRVERRLQKLKWPAPKHFQPAWAEFLAGQLRAVDAAVGALDMADLEGGLHEARRQVRWLSVYAAALGGQLVLDQTAAAPDGWEAYLAPDIIENPFNRLPEPGPGERPLSMPAPLFYALSYLIDRLGQLKDRAQWTETLAHGLEATGSDPSRNVESYLGGIALAKYAAAAEGAKLVDTVLRRDKLLLRMAEAVERQ